MAAPGADGAVLDEDDLVGVGHGDQVVGDDHRGAAVHEAAQRLEDAAGRFGVEAGGGLVEEQDGRVADHGAGDGDALALPAGEHAAALADAGVVAVGQAQDEVVGVGGRGGGGDVLVGGVGAAPADVVGDGAVEDECLLEDGGDVAPQVGECEVAQVDVVEGDRPGVGVVGAQQQLGERGLARAAGADDGDLGAGGDLEVDVVQRGAVGAGVAELDAGDADVAAGAPHADGFGGFFDAGFRVEDLDDAFGAGAGGEDRVGESGEALDGAVELGDVGEEDEQPAEGDAVLGQLPDADADDDEGADGLDERADRGEQAFDLDGAHLGAEVAEVLVAEAAALVVGAVVGLYEGDVAEALLGDGADGSGAAAALAGGGLDAPGEGAGDEQEDRGGDEGGEGELPVQDEHGPGVEDDLEAVGQRHVDAGQHERLDGRDVAGEAGEQVAELAGLEVAGREPVHVVEDPLAQAHDELLADPRGHVLVAEVDEAADDGDGEEGARDEREEAEVLRGDDVVDEDLEQVDVQGAQCGSDGDEQEAEEHPAAEGLCVGPEPSEDVPDRDLGGLADVGDGASPVGLVVVVQVVVVQVVVVSVVVIVVPVAVGAARGLRQVGGVPVFGVVLVVRSHRGPTRRGCTSLVGGGGHRRSPFMPTAPRRWGFARGRRDSFSAVLSHAYCWSLLGREISGRSARGGGRASSDGHTGRRGAGDDGGGGGDRGGGRRHDRRSATGASAHSA